MPRQIEYETCFPFFIDRLETMGRRIGTPPLYRDGRAIMTDPKLWKEKDLCECFGDKRLGKEVGILIVRKLKRRGQKITLSRDYGILYEVLTGNEFLSHVSQEFGLAPKDYDSRFATEDDQKVAADSVESFVYLLYQDDTTYRQCRGDEWVADVFGDLIDEYLDDLLEK